MVDVLRARTRQVQRLSHGKLVTLQRQLTAVKQQKNRLLNLRLVDEIESDTFSAKHAELRDREAELQLQIEAHGRQQSEHAEFVVKVFELSQALTDKWFSAGIHARRRIIEIVCLNLTLDDATLTPTMRKPFGVIAEGLVSQESDPNGI